VSTEASLFSLHFWDAEIFCEKCKLIRNFKIFSQEKYDKNYGKREIPPNKPLYCKCITCEGWIIYATNEFAELQEEPMMGLCKIWGMGNLEAGDLVYHPQEQLCMVEGVNRVSGSLPKITLKNQNEEKFEIQLESLPSDDQNMFYRLLPQHGESARIGDRIYHTETERIGTVVGLEFNGGQAVVVEFEPDVIEVCYCEKSIHYLTDEVLEQNTKWRCRDLPYLQNLQINSHSKVLFLNCLVPSLHAVYELEKIIASIPQARCFLMQVMLEKSNIKASEIYKELQRNYIHLCGCKVELEKNEVYIAGMYTAKDIPKNINNALRKFPLKKIHLDLRMRHDVKIIKTISEKDWFIKLSKIGKTIHMDGWVRSEKQKKRAKWIAFFYTFKFRVENHLWVID